MPEVNVSLATRTAQAQSASSPYSIGAHNEGQYERRGRP